jgi:transposase IS116/IS110/IS902 family protein
VVLYDLFRIIVVEVMGGRPLLRHHRAKMRSLIATSRQGAVHGASCYNRVARPHRSAAHCPRRDRTGREADRGVAPRPRCQSPIGDDLEHRSDHGKRDRCRRAGRHALPIRPEIRPWPGLTPRVHSSGVKERRVGISKQGDGYIRRLPRHRRGRRDPACTLRQC